MFFTGLSGHLLPLLLTAVFPLMFLLSGGLKAEKPAEDVAIEVSASGEPRVYASQAATSGFSSHRGFAQSLRVTGQFLPVSGCPIHLTEAPDFGRIPPSNSPGVPLPAVYHHSGNNSPPVYSC